MLFITFTNSDGPTNEAAFNNLHDRIMTLKGLPTADGMTKDWAQPIAHQTNNWIAMPVDETCYPVMNQTEISSLVTLDNLKSNGWYPSNPTGTPSGGPWWGFLIWWR